MNLILHLGGGGFQPIGVRLIKPVRFRSLTAEAEGWGGWSSSRRSSMRGGWNRLGTRHSVTKGAWRTKRPTSGHFATLLLSLALLAPSFAEEPKWAPWTEPDFPFTSTSLDLRDLDPKSVPMNVVPRGLLLNLGHDTWVCFDTELLRVAAVWTGHGVTPEALGPLSYQEAGNFKTRGGQELLPKPDGKILLWNGFYPGWQLGETVSTEDRKSVV